MNNFLKMLFVSVTIFSFTSVHAQDFPAIEKEVSDILCTGKWTIDSLGKPGKLRSAKEAMMEEVTLNFKSDSTYIITVFGKDKPGKWVIEMTRKQVNMFEKKTDPESIIKSITKDRLLMVRGDGSDLKMIWRPIK